MLGEQNTEQFEIITSVDGREVHRIKIHDPFVRTATHIKGFKAAWLCLTKGLRVTTMVNGSHGAMRIIMMLDPSEMIEINNEFSQTNQQERVGQVYASSIS